MTIYAGTGHRPQDIPGYDYPRLVKVARLGVRAARKASPDCVIMSGGAIGWDMALAEAALWERVPLHMALPTEPEQVCARWDRLPNTRERWWKILSRASETSIVTPGPLQGQAYIQALHARNGFMVERAAHVLAFWSGRRAGGTFGTIRLCEERGVPYTNLFDKF